MSCSGKNVANAVGGKTARACDSCITKRARWYCAADDAFLCQACDSSVHSANPLARRHDRVRLNTASYSAPSAPTWHHGFTKKHRTPRHGKHHHSPRQTENNRPFHLVPEEEEEQVLYSVPGLDSFVGDGGGHGVEERRLHGYLPPWDAEEAEFAADVESMLGVGMGMEEHCGWEEYCCSPVKVEEVEGESKADVAVDQVEIGGDQAAAKRRKILVLQLDYEGVITAWSSTNKSPWTTGDKPTLDLHHFSPHSITMQQGSCGTQVHHPYGELGGYGYHPVMGDGGREARVSRYREKRRTRLFSKKIRYEVRKLNAEKRPRMKGRFVKRTSFAAAAPPTFPLLNKS